MLFDPKLLSSEHQSELFLTLKDYGFPTGVSTHIYKQSKDTIFTVKGPMGKGLQVSQTGLYVAFAGGTGALVFLDLVARIILSNLKLLPE
jgi:NAD(P)H-flavin reductase